MKLIDFPTLSRLAAGSTEIWNSMTEDKPKPKQQCGNMFLIRRVAETTAHRLRKVEVALESGTKVTTPTPS